MSGKIVARLKELGIELPVAPKPVANYMPFTHSGPQVHLCGHLPTEGGKAPERFLGKVGKNVTPEAAAEAAKLCVINMLSSLQLATDGDLDRVAKFVKINVFVNSSEDFTGQPLVANGASNFLGEVNENWKHARSAVGVAQLPLGVAVEIDGIVEITPK